MRSGARIGVVIPALNEAAAIGRVVADVPAWVDHVVVADNGSSDDTGRVAEAAGATVVVERERGYGAACLAGIAALRPVDIVVFVDGDYSDHPADMADLVDPIAAGSADFVLASRATGEREAGSLTPQQVFGNWLATRLIAGIWGSAIPTSGRSGRSRRRHWRRSTCMTAISAGRSRCRSRQRSGSCACSRCRPDIAAGSGCRRSRARSPDR